MEARARKMRTRYVLRNGELVEKDKATPLHSQRIHAQSDITPFMTQDGVEISSRSKLRDYERSRGVRQIGTDWTGSSRPAFWDMHLERQRGSREEPR